MAFITIQIEHKNIWEQISQSIYMKDEIFLSLFTGKFIDVLILLSIASFLFQYYKEYSKILLWYRFTCVIFSIILLIGKCCDVFGSFTIIFSYKITLILSIFYILGNYVLLNGVYIFIRKIFVFLKSKFSYVEKINLYNKHVFIQSFFIILTLWIPYIIFRLPGGGGMGCILSNGTSIRVSYINRPLACCINNDYGGIY